MLSSFTSVLLPVLVLGVVYILLTGLLRLTHDENEPPLALDSIPFLEPIIQLLTRKHKLWLYLRDQSDQPIYTIRLPGVRCYAVNDSSLVLAVDRQIKVLSFAPIEASATAGTLGTTEVTNEIMRRDPTGSNGHFTTFHRAVRPHLSPGLGLDGMVQKSLGAMEMSLWDAQQSGVQNVGFFSWVRHAVLLATTDGEYGSGNPFRDPAFEKAWFKFLPGVPIMASGILPQLFARESLHAREFLAQSFETYFHDGHHLNGSAALLARIDHGVTAGLPAADRARGEVGSSMALVNNTVPAAFWLLYHVFSDPALLAECRAELLKACSTEEDGTRTIDLAHVRSSCPALNSTLLEVFRYYGIGTVLIRQVVEDHKLNGTYLLKKGSYVLMPNVTQHYSPKIWGSDVQAFNPKRFCSAKRTDPAGLRVFGGGTLLCPGRHFANNVILAFAAHVLLRLDIRPVPKHQHDYSSAWDPLKMESSLGLGVAKVFMLPAQDPEVEIRARGPDEVWRVRLL
ncbi:hypothetical protein S40293_02210 [Stachybotrys chartarum IBT 40293]|nr:hypothetical protein S40293_02210 [Stachybotrys chartarum IBT 40293]